jgi:hypothetical protein
VIGSDVGVGIQVLETLELQDPESNFTAELLMVIRALHVCIYTFVLYKKCIANNNKKFIYIRFFEVWWSLPAGSI